jgi:carbamoyltransferase
MAWAGTGTPHRPLTNEIKNHLITMGPDGPEQLYGALDTTHTDDPTIMASFQQAVGEVLVETVERHAHLADNLCFAGGSALNIKWNSALRSSGLFTNMWVPPFPNDSGSAIGTACASQLARGDYRPLNWTVYSGPNPTPTTSLSWANNPQWEANPCSIDALAKILAAGNPVTIISGRAELGPRALGHRSILAPATHPNMKTLLNTIKGRENYRPIAPICLQEDAPHIFDPGTPDPYMLFDHKVRPDWTDRIPAILHLDGTARLQTVTPGTLPHKIVAAYKRLTGIPVLCNTSANYNGRGFFPDAASAMEWGGTNYVWSDDTLYSKAQT